MMTTIHKFTSESYLQIALVKWEQLIILLVADPRMMMKAAVTEIT
jgi:hypothetical protein